MGREVVVAITDGKLDFGPWEQIFYGEFDGRRPKARAGEGHRGIAMQIEHIRSFDDLERYLREFTNFSGDPVPYDFNGAFHLFLAILDNLANNSVDADIEDLREDRPWLTEKQLAFLRKLERVS